jgi:hypothetical protein
MRFSTSSAKSASNLALNFSSCSGEAKAKKWGPEQISERQKGLAALALDAWPL